MPRVPIIGLPRAILRNCHTLLRRGVGTVLLAGSVFSLSACKDEPDAGDLYYDGYSSPETAARALCALPSSDVKHAARGFYSIDKAFLIAMVGTCIDTMDKAELTGHGGKPLFVSTMMAAGEVEDALHPDQSVVYGLVVGSTEFYKYEYESWLKTPPSPFKLVGPKPHFQLFSGE